jgi:Holliday junction resolvase
MRLRARTDANQREIVAALRKVGCSVAVLSSVGKNVPDLAVGYRGQNFFLEVKRDERAAKRKDQTDQRTAQESWRGSMVTVMNVADALHVIGVQ